MYVDEVYTPCQHIDLNVGHTGNKSTHATNSKSKSRKFELLCELTWRYFSAHSVSPPEDMKTWQFSSLSGKFFLRDATFIPGILKRGTSSFNSPTNYAF